VGYGQIPDGRTTPDNPLRILPAGIVEISTVDEERFEGRTFTLLLRRNNRLQGVGGTTIVFLALKIKLV